MKDTTSLETSTVMQMNSWRFCGHLVTPGKGAFQHPNGRKAIFLGDFIDGGQRSARSGNSALDGRSGQRPRRSWKPRNECDAVSYAEEATASRFARIRRRTSVSIKQPSNSSRTKRNGMDGLTGSPVFHSFSIWTVFGSCMPAGTREQSKK